MQFKLKGLVFLFTGLLFGGLMGLSIVWGGSPGQAGTVRGVRSQPPARGVPIAGFELPTTLGEMVRLEQYRGVAVVLNFWATWCTSCRAEMPLLQQVYAKHTPDLVVLGVNASESERLVNQFVDKYGITFPVLMDAEGVVQSLYLVRALPTTFFIDVDGVLRAQHIGELNDELMTGYLELLGVEP